MRASLNYYICPRCKNVWAYLGDAIGCCCTSFHSVLGVSLEDVERKTRELTEEGE